MIYLEFRILMLSILVSTNTANTKMMAAMIFRSVVDRKATQANNIEMA